MPRLRQTFVPAPAWHRCHRHKLPRSHYFSSPWHYLPNLGDGWQLDALRRRYVLMAYGGGRWESPGESWHTPDLLLGKGIPNRVDAWGPEWDHDWPTWHRMLPHYLDWLA